MTDEKLIQSEKTYMDANRKASFDAEAEIKTLMRPIDEIEEHIIELFLRLPKDRQKAILSELWSEFRPETPKGLRNFQNLPY